MNTDQTNDQKPTARETYKQRRSDIARVLDWLDLELDRHGTDAKANPKNWGYPGDLGHIREKLIETLAFISNSEPKEIEDLLAE